MSHRSIRVAYRSFNIMLYECQRLPTGVGIITGCLQENPTVRSSAQVMTNGANGSGHVGIGVSRIYVNIVTTNIPGSGADRVTRAARFVSRSACCYVSAANPNG